MKKTERRVKSASNEGAEIDAVVDSLKDTTNTREYPNLVEIKELIDLIYEKQFNEFELVLGDFRLWLQRNLGQAVHDSNQQFAGALGSNPEDTVTELAEPPIASQSVAANASAHQDKDLHLITSPIVGTFYRAASPTSDPFVKLGDPVEPEMTLCIIEAMKLMNEIHSDVSGIVAKIYVENGQPVEYGQPLFGIRV
jgi:acetyl-CoA carboxylase biotin carboxyl carrier protein